LFHALDGLHLGAARRHWRIEVYSVADGMRQRWVQLALQGKERRMVTLSLAPSDGARRVVTALSSWLADPVDRPAIVKSVCSAA